MQLSALLSLALAASAMAKPTSYAASSTSPTVSLNQTTIIGTAKTYDAVKIEKYLGIPFAAPPIGDLRFARPEAAKALPATMNATDYGAPCAGFIGFSDGLPRAFAEDCLNLNVLRPAETKPKAKLLPVLVWIYGGGFQAGANSDAQYDLTPIVAQAKKLGTPIIAASMNYRLGGFGFLGNNAGLYDQRLALQWIQNNVAAFGGDPDQVTIFGESAGGFSVAHHVNSKGSAGLFSGAIMQSGTSLASGQVLPLDAPVYTKQWATVASATGCAPKDVECLRKLDFDTAFKAFSNQSWVPVVDGDMIAKPASQLLAAGEWNHVPVILGATRDEGTADFWGGLKLESDSDLRSWLEVFPWKLSNASIDRILELYPNDPAQGAPFGSGNITFPSLGAQWKRRSAIAGDLTMHAGRRTTAQTFSKAGQKVWSYRFDQPPWNGVAPLIVEEIDAPAEAIGASHYSEITSVFGTRHPEGIVKWEADPSAEGIALSDSMQRKWIGFAVARNPNLHKIKGEVSWEEYSKAGNELSFRKNATTLIKDNYRKEALEFWTTIWDELSL